MKIGITAKLFLFVLVACAAVVVVQATAFRLVFERGFLGYLNGQGRAHMAQMVPRVAAAYGRHGSWEFLHTDFREWMELLLPFPQGPGADPAPQLAASDQTGALARIGLLDAGLHRIAGNPGVGTSSIRLPVVVEGRTVAWVAMVPFEAVLPKSDARFLDQQLKALTLVGLGSICVAALLTFVLARALLRRVRGMARATHRLATGDYASRIDVGANDELGALAQDFNRMAQTLEHTDRARRTFMADISHELRTPLAVLRAELEAVQDGIRAPTAESVDAMHQEVGRLGKLVDDLHELSLTDVGALAYRRVPIDVGTVLQAVVSSMQGRMDTAGLRLDVQLAPQPMTLSGDERRLQQLFANLMENALRYTDRGGVVAVRCMPRDAWVRIVVEDSAPGVPADKLEKLFERFYRVEASRNRASGGSGLGLAISRNIVEAHEGRIAATASALGGLCVAIELPLSSAAA